MCEYGGDLDIAHRRGWNRGRGRGIVFRSGREFGWPGRLKLQGITRASELAKSGDMVTTMRGTPRVDGFKPF